MSTPPGPSPFDPESLRLEYTMPVPTPRARASRKPQVAPPGEFLGGRPPLAHLAAAARLPGRALHVAVVLWFIAGVERRLVVLLRPSLLRRFGVGRHAGYRALEALESAQLVRVTRARGRAPVVTLLDAVDVGDEAVLSPTRCGELGAS